MSSVTDIRPLKKLQEPDSVSFYCENAALSGSVAIFMFRGELLSSHKEPLMVVLISKRLN
ncbi:MAG: hypothetical protein ACR2PT_22575 [Endozoicomonas sp.]